MPCIPADRRYIITRIGNLRSYIMEDVLEKALRYVGYDVKRVMNITDVGHLSSDADTGEDKMLKGAKREHKTVMEIAKFYTDAFFDDCKKLNIKRPDVVEPATNCIPEFIHMIEVLLEKGYAYVAGGNVYFDTSRLDDYYVFSSQSEKELLVGVRDDVEEDVNKRNKNDFVLWFTKSKFEDQALKWDSPWGVGYPGWHIECSAMSRTHLGKTIDLHAGGQDLIFPHHENEIAQSECANGCEFAHYWMHNGFINVDNQKMSKSLHNFFTVRDVADLYGYEPIRYFMLTAGYRMPLNYTVDLIESCKNSLERLYTCRENLDFALSKTDFGTDETLKEKAAEARTKFCTAMDDDLNTPDALAAIFDLVKDINTLSDASDKATLETAAKTFDELTGVLGLLYNRKKTDSIPAEVTALVEERAAAKKAKDWGRADADRDGLECHRHGAGPEAREAVRFFQKTDAGAACASAPQGAGVRACPLFCVEHDEATNKIK